MRLSVRAGVLGCVGWFCVMVAGGCAVTQEPEIEVADLASHHGEAVPWTSLDALDGAGRFHFAVVTDRTGAVREGVFPVGVEKLNLVQPAFVVSVGDLIEGYTEDRGQIVAEWDELEGMTAQLDAPFFYVAGNHDLMNAPMQEVWDERFGASYYHFRYKDVLFIALNSEVMAFDEDGPHRTGGPGNLAWRESQAVLKARADQLAYVQAVLDENTDVRWTFVFVHKPFWREGWAYPPYKADGSGFDFSDYPVEGPWPTISDDPAGWVAIQEMLGDRDFTAFAGHLHAYEYTDAGDGAHTHDLIALATTGGVSNLRGLSFGEFDHIVWVTMTEDGPVIANLLLDGVHGKDMPTPDHSPWFLVGADANGDDE